MKKIDSFTQACYDYLDQIQYYMNDPTQLGPCLESKFGLECYIARQIVGDWFGYHEARLTHPFDRERFQRWRSRGYAQPSAA